jgi:hypothetical protein
VIPKWDSTPRTKESEMKVKLTMLGLAAIALLAVDVLAILASAVQDPADLSNAFGIGLAALSAYVGTLAVSRIGATTGWTLSRSSVTRRSTRTGTVTAPTFTTDNYTVAPQLLSAAFTIRRFTSDSNDVASEFGEGRDGQLQNPRYDCVKPTISPVMAY